MAHASVSLLLSSLSALLMAHASVPLLLSSLNPPSTPLPLLLVPLPGLTPEEAAEKPYIASMGIYVFKKDALVKLLTEVRWACGGGVVTWGWWTCGGWVVAGGWWTCGGGVVAWGPAAMGVGLQFCNGGGCCAQHQVKDLDVCFWLALGRS